MSGRKPVNNVGPPPTTVTSTMAVPKNPPVGQVAYPLPGAGAATAPVVAPPPLPPGHNGHGHPSHPAHPPPPGYDYYAAQRQWYQHYYPNQHPPPQHPHPHPHAQHHPPHHPPQQQHYPPTPHQPPTPQQQQQESPMKQVEANSSHSHSNKNDQDLLESSIAPEVSGRYAPLLKVRRQRQMENAATIPLPRRMIGGLRDQIEQIKACSCPKSSCLKLYCACFVSGIYCKAHCACPTDMCRNDGAAHNQHARNKAILQTLQENSHAFRPKVPTKDDVQQYHQEQQQVDLRQQQKQKTSQQQKTVQRRQEYLKQHHQQQQSNNKSGKPSILINPKKQQQQQALDKQTPCNCRKSKCLKKYCECFSGGHTCQKWCNCRECENYKGSKERARTVGHAGATTNAKKGASLKATNAQQVLAAGQRGHHTSGPAAAARLGTGATTINTAGNLPASMDELAGAPSLKFSLPPSMQAAPMKIINLEIVSLAFGQVSNNEEKDNNNKKKRKAAYGGEIDNYMLHTGGAATSGVIQGMTAEAAAMARRRQEVLTRDGPHKKQNVQPTHDTQAAGQRKLALKWTAETQDVIGTFQAMRQELLERDKDAKLQEGDIALAREYSYYDIVGSAQLAAVEIDLADVVTSIREAGDRARNLLGEEPQLALEAGNTKPVGVGGKDEAPLTTKTPPETDKPESMDVIVDKESSPAKPATATLDSGAAKDTANDADPQEESLLCTEEDVEVLKDDSEKPGKEEAKIAPVTKREKTIVKAAEDAAMMRELARIIRRQALEMAAARSSKFGLAP